LLVALASGKTVEVAAKESGVTARTVHRRLSQPEFRKAVDDLRGQFIERAAATLAESSTSAATALQRLLKDKNAKVKLQAARAILELATKLRTNVSIEARVRALEEARDNRKPN
jgi:hypothetical protein